MLERGNYEKSQRRKREKSESRSRKDRKIDIGLKREKGEQ